MNGTIRKILIDKQFGFISSGRDDYFFHRQDCTNGDFEEMYMKYMNDKLEVEFTPDKTDKGLRARNVLMKKEY